MRTSKIALIVLFIVALIAGCSKHESAPKSEGPASESATTTRGHLEQTTADVFTSAAERMVIKNANLTIENDTPQETSEKVQSIVQSHGGFLVNTSVQQIGEEPHVSITLRVPSEHFDATLAELRGLGDVRFEAVKGEDVTEEFMDLQSQLRNQRALESRFVELLGQAATVAETIEVERELARVRTEVERLEGRSKFLSDRVALSTVELEIQPSTSFGDASTSIIDEVSDAFADSGEIVAVVIGGLIRIAAGFLPISVCLALMILFFRAISRRRKR